MQFQSKGATAVWDVALKFDPNRVSVKFCKDTSRAVAQPHGKRRYTLTHNDLTRQLTLSVGQRFNNSQISVWYTRLLRDEILAEWREDGLHVHCQVSVKDHWWISWARSLRAVVFRQKLPLVLDTLRYADRELFIRNPQLLEAPVYVHFHEAVGFEDSECWGQLETAGVLSTDPVFPGDRLIAWRQSEQMAQGESVSLPRKNGACSISGVEYFGGQVGGSVDGSAGELEGGGSSLGAESDVNFIGGTAGLGMGDSWGEIDRDAAEGGELSNVDFGDGALQPLRVPTARKLDAR